MSQLTPRLEIAKDVMIAFLRSKDCRDQLVESCPSDPDEQRRILAGIAVAHADDLLAAASQSTDCDEMARTIQRLEARVEILRTELDRAANTWDGDRREQAMHNALNSIRYSAVSALSKDDTERYA